MLKGALTAFVVLEVLFNKICKYYCSGILTINLVSPRDIESVTKPALVSVSTIPRRRAFCNWKLKNILIS